MLAGILIQLLRTFHFLWTVSPEKTAYAEVMVVDGDTYLSNVARMLEQGSWFFAPDRIHSVGMQLTTASLARVFGLDPLVVKCFNFVCFVASLGLVVSIAKGIGLTRRHALFAALLVASSLSLQRYCAMTQYEHMTMLLVLTAVFCVIQKKSFSFGTLMTVLCVFRLHFIPILLPLAWWLVRRSGRNELLRAGFAFALTFALVYVPYSIHFGDWSGFQAFPEGPDRRWLCLGAPGFNYPHFRGDETSICGWSFVMGHPLEYLTLVIRRFFYWIGWLPDIWVVRWPSDLLEKSTILIVCGLNGVAAFSRRIAADTRALSFTVAFSFAPFVIAGASNRYLLPFLPLAVLAAVSVAKSGTSSIRQL